MERRRSDTHPWPVKPLGGKRWMQPRRTVLLEWERERLRHFPKPVVLGLTVEEMAGGMRAIFGGDAVEYGGDTHQR